MGWRVSDPIPALLLLCACLLVGATLLRALGPLPKSACAATALALSGIGIVLSLVALLRGEPGEAWALPLGPPGMALLLSVDALAAFFVLLVFLAGGVTVTSG